MLVIANTIHALLPLCAIIGLILGLIKKAFYFVIASLWLSLIALIIYHQNYGGEILAPYFSYNNALLYSISLIVLTLAILYLMTHLDTKKRLINYLATLLQAFLVVASGLILANLWINAYFAASKLEGTPIIQVALIEKPSYCKYNYVFYKITPKGLTEYLCPNYYGFIPKIGHLTISPEFLTRQLSLPNKQQLLKLQQKKKVD